jgi:Yip1 domain
LRPRRVFREMATRPVGIADYLLGAAQGIVNCLFVYRIQGAGSHNTVGQILANSLAYGAVVGVASMFLMAAIYRRLGARAGGKATTAQVIHVLAYGGVPLVASAALQILTALLVGEAAFVQNPRADLESFLVLLLHLQFISYVLLLVWSVVLQVMGFSEIQGIATRKAFGVWVLGQLIGLLLSLFLTVMMNTLFPA